MTRAARKIAPGEKARAAAVAGPLPHARVCLWQSDCRCRALQPLIGTGAQLGDLVGDGLGEVGSAVCFGQRNDGRAGDDAIAHGGEARGIGTRGDAEAQAERQIRLPRLPFLSARRACERASSP